MEATLEVLKPVRRLKTAVDEKLESLRISCLGVRPLILDSSEPQDESEEGRRRRKPKPSGPPPKGYKPVPLVEVCAPKLFRGSTGDLGFPGDLLEACLIEGGRFIEIAGRTLTSKWESLLPGVVTVRESFIAFPEGTAWVPDKRKGKDSAMLKRPRFDTWSFSCTLDIRLGALEGLTLKHIEGLVRVSGRRAGIGSFRHAEFKLFPDQEWQPAIFGAFRLVQWDHLQE